MEFVPNVEDSRSIEYPTVKDKLITFDERDLGRILSFDWFLRSNGARFKIDHFECLFDVKSPRFAVGSHSIPVKQAKRRVTGLLNFGHDTSGT